MKIEKNKLVKMCWKSKEFGDSLYVDDVDGLILDSIRVFGKVPNGDCQEIPFYIRKINGKTIIYPQVYADKFYVCAQKIVRGNMIQIERGDCIYNTFKNDGTYTFLLKDNIKID